MTYPTDEQLRKLAANGLEHGADHVPVIMIELIGHQHSEKFVFTEINPRNPRLAFGLCDVNDGKPKMRKQDLVKLAERAIQYNFSLKVTPIEKPYPISVYEAAAAKEHAITTDEADLSDAAAKMFLNTIDLTEPKNKGPDAPREKGLTP